ncbi:MAG TPA: hypothetical protein VF784_08895 [Anaerolineales bacterium]
MRVVWLLLACLSLSAAACTAAQGAPATPSSVPTEFATQTAAQRSTSEPPILATPTHIPVDIPPAQRSAIASLAQTLSVSADKISIVSSEAVTWPNGCMGVQRLGVMCTQNTVPGFRIVLSANGMQYELHTNLDGSIIVPADMAMQVPGPSEQAALKQLAKNLEIAESDIKLVSSSPVEWRDGCLGVALEGVMCSQMVTPGYLIVLEASGRQYEYHTSQDGSAIMPATLAMDWKEQGGIAGICAGLTIYLSGEVYELNCNAGGDSHAAVLTAAQRTQLYAWIDQFASSTIELSDPNGVADAMSRTADLAGKGQQVPGSADQHAIFDFGQKLYTQLAP